MPTVGLKTCFLAFLRAEGNPKGLQNERVVIQYHYTQWPDMGVPEHALPVLTFGEEVWCPHAGDGPKVAHCR